MALTFFTSPFPIRLEMSTRSAISDFAWNTRERYLQTEKSTWHEYANMINACFFYHRCRGMLVLNQAAIPNIWTLTTAWIMRNTPEDVSIWYFLRCVDPYSIYQQHVHVYPIFPSTPVYCSFWGELFFQIIFFHFHFRR